MTAQHLLYDAPGRAMRAARGTLGGALMATPLIAAMAVILIEVLGPTWGLAALAMVLAVSTGGVWRIARRAPWAGGAVTGSRRVLSSLARVRFRR